MRLFLIKLLLLTSLFSSCSHQLQHAEKRRVLIFEYTGEVNKPVPVLIFSNDTAFKRQYGYFEYYVIKIDIIKEMYNCGATCFKDTFLQYHTLYKITSIEDNTGKSFFIYDSNVCRLYACLKNIFENNNLNQLLQGFYHLRRSCY